MYRVSEECAELAAEVIREHPDLQWINTAGITIGFIETDKEKNSSVGPVLGECQLVQEIQKLFCPYDFLIVIYLPNITHLNRDQMKILLYHEMLHVDMSEKNGNPIYRVAPHDVQDFKAVIRQYGMQWAGD